MGNPERITVLLVDDHMISVLGTKALLKSSKEIVVVDVATNLNEVFEILNKTKVDIVLLDLYMPEHNGFEILKMIKMMDDEMKVVILTISEEKDKILKAIALNADGYVFKDTSGKDLSLVLKRVFEGKKGYDGRVFDYIYDDLQVMINNKKMESSVRDLDDIKETLTPRELEIMKLMADRKSSQEISDEIGISKYTVSTHRRNLYTKLKISSLTEMTLLAQKLLSQK